jgi:Flp pilus assembly protein TadD
MTPRPRENAIRRFADAVQPEQIPGPVGEGELIYRLLRDFRTPFVALLLCVCACQSSNRGLSYRTGSGSDGRDAHAAQRLNEEGLRLIEQSDHERAEERFRRAIEADIYYPAAHNNLGLACLKAGRHYEAAWEFQYAAKLSPKSSEPRSNLGTLYEHIGRMDLAVDEYEAALEIDPSHMEAMRHLARAYIKTDQNRANARSLLERLLLVSDDEQWDSWARGQLIRLGRVERHTIGAPESDHGG